jgi:hypothetical protein
MINILKIYAADGTLDILHTLSASFPSVVSSISTLAARIFIIMDISTASLNSRRAVRFSDAFDRACHGGGYGSRQKSRSVARRNISAVKTDSFFNKLAPAFAVVPLLPSVNAFQCR